MSSPPATTARAPWPLPYRVLFPIGIANAILAAGLWPMHAAGLGAWPGIQHQILMILGFEQSFVFGFLLTAMPAFTGGPPCRRIELAIPVASVLCVDGFVLAGLVPAAIAAWLVGIASLVATLARRVVRAPSRPPAEFLFAALGLVLGLVGGAFLLGDAAGWWFEPQPRFGIRLISLGFVLSLVLGLGALLVPTFSGMRDPMQIPGLARAHQRGPRATVYLPLALLLAGAFVAEGFGLSAWGAWLRTAAAAAMLLLAWKIWRVPGRRDVPALTLWGSGWMTLAGLFLAAAWPSHPIAGEHTVFIGGFGLLTLGIGTRVIVSHGGHPLAREPRALGAPIAVGVLAALGLRLVAEASPALMTPLLGWSGAAWVLAWAWWGAHVLGLIVKTAPRALVNPTSPPGPRRWRRAGRHFESPLHVRSLCGRMARMKSSERPAGKSASLLIDQRIRDLEDWRGETLARMRKLILEAVPGMTEEWKWENPVWSHDGIVCTGEAYKKAVKLTFAKGASLPDPSRLFNSSLEGATRRAIDIPEGEKVDARAFKALIKAAVAHNGTSAKKR